MRRVRINPVPVHIRRKACTRLIVRKRLHPTVRMLNDEPFGCSKHFVGDEEGADGILADAPARIADHISLALGESCKLCRIETAVHAGDNGEMPRRMVGQTALVAKVCRIAFICCKNFLYIGAQQNPSFHNPRPNEKSTPI